MFLVFKKNLTYFIFIKRKKNKCVFYPIAIYLIDVNKAAGTDGIHSMASSKDAWVQSVPRKRNKAPPANHIPITLNEKNH